MELGFDIDGVVNDLVSHLIGYVDSSFGIKLGKETFKGYWLEKSTYVDDEKLNNEIIESMLKVVCDIDFQVKAKPYKDAVKALKLLKKSGHSLHFITSRNVGKDAENKTAEWFKHNGIKFDSLNHCGINGSKGVLGKNLNLEFYLDDHEMNLTSMYEYKRKWRKGLCLFTQVWNKGHIDGSRFIRLNNWEEVLRHLGVHKR